MSSPEPPERDVKDFEFIQLVKFRVASSGLELSSQRGKLLACSSQYGLLVYATKQGFSVIQTAELVSLDEANSSQRSKAVVEDVPVLVSVPLSSPVLCMDISGDGLFLAVVIRDMGQMVILFYDIRAFVDKDSNKAPFGRSLVNASSAAVVLDLSWNPAVFTLLSVCTSDGNVELVDLTDSPKIIAVLPAAAGATCFCWSPKGKQLLVGRKDGSLAQYDHALTEKKVWCCPDILSGSNTVVDVVWQSTYTFLAAYLPAKSQPTNQPSVIMTTSNKNNQTMYINFEDVCYGNGDERKDQYFFHFLQKWDVILMASSNATEATVVGRNLDDQTSWEHWNLEDSCRAQLPLTEDQNDSFPMGLVVDYSTSKNIVISDTKTLPPCPVMYLLSTDGMLLGFYLSYTHKLAAPATLPAQPLASAGVARRGELTALTSAGATPQSTSAGAAPQSTVAVDLTVSGAATIKAPPQAAAPVTKSAVPASAFSGQATFSFQPAVVPTSSSQLTFASSMSPSLFGGTGFRQATPTSPATSQKPQIPAQTAFGLSGSSQSSFGSQSLGAPSFSFGASATSTPFSNLGSSSALSQAAQTVGNNLFQSQPSVMPGAAHPSVSLVPAQQPNAQPMFSVATTNTTSNIFGHSPAVSQPPKHEEPKPSPALTSSEPHPTGAGQLRPAPSAFTSRPTGPAQGTPGTGLVISSTSRPAGPAQSTPGTGLVVGSTSQSTGPAQGTAGTGLVAGNKINQTSPGGTGPVTTTSPQHPQSAAVQTSVTPGTGSKMLPTASSSSMEKSIEATVDSVFTQNILEEITDFEQELAELRLRSRREVKMVGTREEMLSLRQDRERMVNFSAEISKVTKELLSEAQEQKSLCFNLLAMAEECKTRHEKQADPHYHSLLMSRTLDPASAERLKSLQQMAQYIEQSILEVDRTLDAQWLDYKTNKKKEERFYSPAGETIYKSIKNNHMVISSQRQQLDKLEEQLRNLRLYNKLSGGGDVQSLSLIHSEHKLSPIKGTQNNATWLSTVANGMTPEKVTKLREVLSQRKVPRVKSTAPANLSMSRIIQTSLTSPSTPATPPPQQQQQAAAQPRKHQLQPPVQNIQHFIPTGQVDPETQKHPASQPQPHLGLVRGTAPPTSFTGTAYFKQPHPTAATSLSKTGPVPASRPITTSLPKTGLVPASQQVTTSLSKTGLAPTSQSPASSLPNTGLALTSPAPGSRKEGPGFLTGTGVPLTSTPETRMVNLPQPNYGPTTSHNNAGTVPSPWATAKTAGLRGSVYEDVTPTETEEDEDDYDDEDNGYEDEEEEEDEEEAGFGGVLQTKTALVDAVTACSSTPSSTTAAAFAGRDLFGAKTFAETLPTQGKSGSTDSVPSLLSHVSGGASSQVKPLFGQRTDIKFGTGFTFGGPAAFGDKTHATGAAGHVFGSQGTPSKFIGFQDLTTKPAAVKDEGPSSTTVQTATECKPSSDTRAASLPTIISKSASAFTFAQAAAGSNTEDNKVTSGSVFGGGTPQPTTASVFGGAPQASTTSVFGGGTPQPTTASVFGGGVSQVTTASVFGGGAPLATTTSVFGGGAPQATTTSVFGGGAPLATTASVFGGGAPQATTTSVFGGKSPSESSKFSFGTAPSSSTPAPVFGAASPPTISTASPSDSMSVPELRGVDTSQGDNTTTSAQAGAPPAVKNVPGPGGTEAGLLLAGSSSKSSPIPGETAAATPLASGSALFARSEGGASKSSVFGGSVTSEGGASKSSVFGGSVTSEGGASKSSVFGGSITSEGGASKSSVFGGSVTEGVTSKPSAFGSLSTTEGVTSMASVFGGASSTGNVIPGFGINPETSASPFASTSAGFSGATASITSSASASGTSSSLFSTPSGFSGGTTAPALFSAGTSVFGSSGSGQPASLFATTTTSSAPAFGFPTASSAGSLFGQTSSSSTSASGFSFGQALSAGDTSAGFGNRSPVGTPFGFGGLGGKPSEEKARTNVFGTPQVFGGSSNHANNLFGGGASSSSFGGSGSSSMSFTTGTGRFSSASAGVGTSGFSVGATGGQHAATGGFGSSAFGSSPSFGGAAVFGSTIGGFGSSPTFGSAPAFGSTSAFSSMAGSAPTFGASTTGAGFSGFVNTSAPSFGQLAQASSPSPGFGGSDAFGSSTQPQTSPFGSSFGSAFGQGTSATGFGGGQAQGFVTNSSFGSNPAFSSYRG